MKKIYLDHNATCPVHPEVKKAMLPFMEEAFGNASSVHSFGREAHAAMEKAREEIAKFVNCAPDEFVFTSGGTESDSFALRGVMRASNKKSKHIITSTIEHPAVLNTAKALEAEGVRVSYIPVDECGIVDVAALKKEISDDTVLISIMMANNEVGTIQPINEISKIAKEKGILFHTDSVQALAKAPIDFKKLPVDLASFSAHKIYGPKGVGGIFIRKGTKIKSIQLGGHHEHNRRAGTENVPAIVGFAKACEVAYQDGEKELARIKDLRDKLAQGLTKNITEVKLNGHPEKRLPNTLNLSFNYIEGESILLNLDMEGIAVSTGSACTSGSLEPSHVLIAMGVEPVYAQGSVRFSLGYINNEEEIDRVIEVLPPIVERLRKMSPLNKESSK